MKKILASFGWVLLLIPFISIAGTKSLFNSKFSEETRTVSNFNGIASAGSFDVFVKMGSKESLRLEGDAEQLKEIETKVENGILKIRYKKNIRNNWRFNDRGKVNVYITARSLSNIALSGSGEMEIDGTVKAPKVDAAVSGSGSINLKVSATTFNAKISGSGDVTASGEADVSNIAISGSGEFEGKKLRTKETNAKVSGSGEATVTAGKNLNAVISGSGDIFYSGEANVNITKSGSGKVTKI